MKAYKDGATNQCYVEKLNPRVSSRDQKQKKSGRIEYIVGKNLTKYEVC